MGRPAKILTDDQLAQLEKLAAVLTVEQIGDFFGISTRTLSRRFANDPVISAAYKRGKANAVGKVATTLLQLADKGNVIACMFYLKTQGRWREQDRDYVPAASESNANEPFAITVEFEDAAPQIKGASPSSDATEEGSRERDPLRIAG